MASVNKVILVGNLGRDPEVRRMPSGDAMVNLSIATTDTWKDKGGERQEKTEWHRVVMFGRVAEVAGEYLKKGSQAYFEGRLQTRKWTDKEGQDKYTTEVVADRMQMLGSRSGSGGGGGGESQSSVKSSGSSEFSGGLDDLEDDIPFQGTGFSATQGLRLVCEFLSGSFGFSD